MTNWMESWIAKVAGGLFATVVAPIAVAMGLKYSDAVVPAAGGVVSQAGTTAPTQTNATGAAHSPSASTSEAPTTGVPGANNGPRVVRLFNGRDLSGFNTWLGPLKKGGKPIGVNQDRKHVFQVVDGMLRISGEIDGLLTTRQPYGNYTLSLEYKWGDKTWGPRQGKSRTSGLVLHLAGKGGENRSRSGIKCQIKEGATGDFVLFGPQHNGIPSLTVEAARREINKGKQHLVLLSYQPGAPLTTVSTGFVSRTHRDAQWRDVEGFRGRDELELPAGQWNTLECVCQGDTITTRVNGETVNVAAAVRPQQGRIALQSAGAEIFFRRIELRTE